VPWRRCSTPLTHNGRHQALLDDVLAKLIELLQNEQTRTWVAQSIVAWLKKDHPRTEKLLPSDWLGDKGSALLARAEGDAGGGRVSRAATQQLWTDPGTGYRRRALSPPGAEPELVQVELPPGAITDCP